LNSYLITHLGERINLGDGSHLLLVGVAVETVTVLPGNVPKRRKISPYYVDPRLFKQDKISVVLESQGIASGYAKVSATGAAVVASGAQAVGFSKVQAQGDWSNFEEEITTLLLSDAV
jgi:hypothetical protein